jgi:hypothetical protein
MTDLANFAFSMERTSYKSQNPTYIEPGFKLVVYLEMSGIKDFDWVGCDTSFLEWTSPAKEHISEIKRAEIRTRLHEWSRAQGIRLQFGPPMNMQAYLADLQAKGHSIKHQPDGTILVTPKRRVGMLEKIGNFLRRKGR